MVSDGGCARVVVVEYFFNSDVESSPLQILLEKFFLAVAKFASLDVNSMSLHPNYALY